MSYFRPTIERMEGYVPGYQPKEPGYVKLNTNENPYPPSPRALEAIARAAGESLRLYPDPTGRPFREQAARVLGTSPDRIICANGSDELLTMALRSFCGEGDAVAFPTPTYSLYPKLAEIQGAHVVAVEFPEDFSLPPGLAEAGAPLTLLCNPNAPSGTLTPKAEVERLARSVAGVLLVDEAYVAFADEDCLDLVARHENVVIARTLSKSHSLAGLRFGFAVGPEPLIAGMAKVKESYNVDRLALAGATAAIADVEWTAENVRKIRATRGRLIAGLRELGFTCPPSQANFVFARVPQGRQAGDVFERLFERKVLVRYWNAPRLDDCLRITVGTDGQTATVLDTLREILT
ncbi:MAG: histidinol-phosphate transaminase [Candidatus Brocadiaceae bacterium]|nr:histidinol-phosphate transaminase [Candidatus Brocadiaceae bacterium]